MSHTSSFRSKPCDDGAEKFRIGKEGARKQEHVSKEQDGEADPKMSADPTRNKRYRGDPIDSQGEAAHGIVKRFAYSSTRRF